MAGNDQEYYRQLLVAAGVLAGVLFAALILVLQNTSNFHLSLVWLPTKTTISDPKLTFDGIVTGVAGTIAFLTFSGLMMTSLASNKIPENSAFGWFARILFVVGITGFAIALVTLVWTVTFWGAVVIFIVEVGLSLTYFGLWLHDRHKQDAL
jgi:hypothetical protein